jgi:uncharacterized membrane protein
MKNLSTTVAIYSDLGTAEKDWAAVEAASKDGRVDLADAALVKREADSTITTVKRQEFYGWGKGAITGALVGLVFPPSIIVSAAVGAAGGSLITRLSRSLSREDIKDLGEVMDAGDIDMVVVTHEDSVKNLVDLLEGATKTLTKASSTAEEVREAINADASTAGPS